MAMAGACRAVHVSGAPAYGGPRSSWLVHAALCVGVAGTFGSVSRRASAQPAQAVPSAPAADAGSSDIDRARALAKAANRALQEAQSYTEALDYATRAEALYHAPFHLWLISQALVGLHRLSEAITTLERLVSEPLAPTAPEVFRTAQEDGRRMLKTLTAREPSVLVVVKGPAASAATATLDDKPFPLTGDAATWVDPGDHRIHVEAPGYQPFDTKVSLPAKGGVVLVEAALPSVQPAASLVPSAPQNAPQDAPSATRAPASPRSSRVPWIAAFGVGAAGLVVGGVTGAVFLSKLSGIKSRCPDDACAPSEQSNVQSVQSLGNISTVAWVVGGVGVATGGVLLLVLGAGGTSSSSSGATSSQTGSGLAFALTPMGIGARGSF